MAKNDFAEESAVDYEQKCLVCFVLDISVHMHGNAIELLNKWLQDLYSGLDAGFIHTNLDISIITFNNNIHIIQEPVSMEDFTMPHLSATDYGSMAMEDAANMAINIVEHRKEWYKMSGQPSCRPLIVLVSSVGPNYFHKFDALAKRIKRDTANYKYSFIPIGFDISHMETLDKIRGDWPPIILTNTALNFVLRHIERLLDEDIPLVFNTKEQIERVDLEGDWVLDISI